MSLKRYIVRRFVSVVVIFYIIATIIFFVFRQVGDPRVIFLTPHMTTEQYQRIEESFGLTDPLWVQYLSYLWNITTLDLGMSFYYLDDVTPIIFTRLVNSLFLTIPSIILAYTIGVLGGVFLAWRRGDRSERLGLLIALVFRSTPRFWVGLLLLFVFSATYHIFPFGGMIPAGTQPETRFHLLLYPEFYWHLVLPVISMTLYLLGLPLLLMRTSMLEVIDEDFVDVCRAKGLSEIDVMYKHVARNALLPVLTAFAVAVAFAFGGNVLVEVVFTYPGIGRLMVDSVFRGDYPVAQFAFLLMAAMVLIMNLLADILYGYLDPRVTYD